MKKLYSLIDKIYRLENLQKAFKSVKRNNGAPGIDGVSVSDFSKNLQVNIERLHEELKTNHYKPSAVRRVVIGKPDGGTRLLGIPTVRDRVVQQAFVNVVEPYYDKDFHPSNYGYRRGKSQHQAVSKASLFMRKYELEHVVDMDLSKCFDTLDHDLILDALSHKISDGRVLSLVKQFLKSGIMEEDVFVETETGTPQGGVCSPLLSNIYLDYFDQKMKSKGIRMVRYADDILIFASSKKEAGDYKHIATKILEEELKLKVNTEKTRITSIFEGVAFLGFIIKGRHLKVNPKRLKRFKEKIRLITKRNQSTPIGEVIKRLNPVLRGWLNYFRIADIKSLIKGLTAWIRRRLRSIRMKQWKTYKKMHKELDRKGIVHDGQKMNVILWKNSKTREIHELMPNAYFRELKLYDLSQQEVGLLSSGKVAW